MLCVTTRDGTYKHVNQAWARVLGWPFESVEGRPFRDFVHPDELALVEHRLQDLAQGQGDESLIARLRTVDGSYRTIAWRTAYDAAADEVLAAGRDVTERVTMERRLVAREQKLANLVAYQARHTEELLARLAGELHDSVVQNNVAALMFLEAEATAASPSAEGAADQMRLSLQAMRRIMAGLDPIEERFDDAASGFREIAPEVAQQFGAEIGCVVSGTAELPEAVGRTAFRAAREGLVNACKHAHHGPIRLEVCMSGDLIRILVHDPGTDQHGVAHLGTGRGLVLLESRVRSHGGDLVLTTSAHGSTLAVEIADQRARRSWHGWGMRSSSPRGDGGGMTILMVKQTTCVMVDDHEVVRAGMRGRLGTVDWLDLVGEASTAREALDVLVRTRPDVVLMDVRLPDGDGMQVARAVLEQGIDCRVVLFSGVATTRQAEQALEAGIYGFVLKDSSLATVIDALAAARDGRRYIDPTIAAEMFAPSTGTMARPLSPRELEILTLMADGWQNAGIAHALGISTETVKAHVSNILGKFDVDGRTQAVATALREGIIE